jgi:hypothetical protein
MMLGLAIAATLVALRLVILLAFGVLGVARSTPCCAERR